MRYSNDPSELKRSLAAARAEIERLTKERDEARAQVAAAYGAAERALEARKYGAPDEREEYAFDAALDRGIVAIRRLTPADAKAALEAYGREKARDEARAQVAAAYELAAQAKVFMPEEGGFLTRVPLLPETKAAIRALTPADAQAALEAYGREKVREGMQRAADIALCHSDDRPRRYSMDWNDGYIDGCKGASDAILADMETLK